MTNEMGCKELVEIITQYLEGALSPQDRPRFEEHLAICPGCQTYLDQMRVTIRALGKLTEESISPQARAALLAAFRNWKHT
jgi:anti-sigma factor RsiW